VKSPAYRIAQVRSLLRIFKSYGNPWLMLWLRLGWLRIKYFPFAIRSVHGNFTMLGRPATQSMADQFTLQEVFLREDYQDILPLLPARPLRVVDVGANIGAFTVWLKSRHELGEVFCFEPEQASRRLLRANLALNDCEVHVLAEALGGTSRTTSITPNLDHPQATNIYKRQENRADAQTIRVVALREWLAATPGDFDLLKLDCECAEWEIVASTTREDLRRFKVVVIEVHGDMRETPQPVSAFARLMEERGFETIRWDNVTHGLYIGRYAN